MNGENGSYVTRAEMRANLDPIKADIKEIKDDVKSLLREGAARDAVDHVAEFTISRRVSLYAVLAAALITLPANLLFHYWR